MAVLMTNMVPKEWAALSVANTDLQNAFGYVDDPEREGLEWSVGVWHQAASAAQRLADMAVALGEAARALARDREEQLEEV